MAFKLGHTAWNKDMRVATNTGKTHFKKGVEPWNKGVTSPEEKKIKAKKRIDNWLAKNPERKRELNRISQHKMYANPIYRAKKQKEEREKIAKLKQAVYENYGMVCACCGEDNPLFLTIDHVNNDGFATKTSGGNRYSSTAVYRKIVKEGFPDTFQVLCMNCNFGKSRNKGICPHKN
jgi:hypothetical protein